MLWTLIQLNSGVEIHVNMLESTINTEMLFNLKKKKMPVSVRIMQ